MGPSSFPSGGKCLLASRLSPSLSEKALARNPLRSLIASITATPPNTSKDIINLGLGDPTHYPLHPPPPAATTAVVEAVVSGRANGYVSGTGTSGARQAISDYHATWDGVEYDADSIVMVSRPHVRQR